MPQQIRAQSGPRWGVRGSDLFQYVLWMLGFGSGESGGSVDILSWGPFTSGSTIYIYFYKRMYIISPVEDEHSNVGRLKLRRSSSSTSRRKVAGEAI